ncbi:unnamed protein product [Ectocarpus sp. 4 AP-2014]
MGIESGSLREVLYGATPDELRGLLLALEGRVVHVGAVTGLLERLRPPATAPVARSSSSSNSDSAVVQQPAAALKTSSLDCAVSSPAPATKRARCGDTPDRSGGGGGGGGGGDTAAAAAANSVRSAALPPPAAKDASGTGGPTASAPPDAEMTAPRHSGSKSSGRSAGADATTAGGRNEAEASSTQGLGTGHTRAAASQAPVPPQGPRGLSWREKQRQKAAEKEAGGGGGGGGGNKKGRKSKKGAGQQRDFDHSRWRKRTVAVQLMYEGGAYAGFCSQSEGNEETIEKHLFRALMTTKLVQTITTGDNYSRCGRTDRGVSALGNVITVSMRSKFPKHVPDADLPTSPLGSLWVAPTAPPSNGAEPVGENDGGLKKENQTMPEGSAAAEQEQPAAGVADEGSGLAKGKNSEGCPSDSRHPASGASEPCTAAGGGEVGRGEVASGNPPGGGGGGGSSVVAGAADAGAGENGGGGGGGLRGSEGERGGGLGGGNGNGNGKTKNKHKKKSRMGGGSGGGGPPAGGEITEIDYCGILNRVLPPGVRALAWAPVTTGFSARFSCSDRTYRYFFMARDMNIKAMNEAASKIVGSHDFRNLCKIDVANVSNFVRHIKHASVRPVPSPSPSNTSDQEGTARGEEEEEYYRVCVFEVCGQAFLWHMVRCLMAVLFMVGRGLESPDVMSFLLDMERCPGKPHYDMAPDGPLLLHGCRFRSLNFQYTPENLYCLQEHLESLWEDAAITAARLLNNLEYLAGVTVSAKDLDAFATFKRALKGSNDQHYSVVDHGEQGRRREKELKQQQQQQQQQGGTGDSQGTRPGEETAGRGDDEDMTWREGLRRLRNMGLGVGQVLGRKGHMPMKRRQQGLHYNELVEGLGGKKRERLDRHLAMKAAGMESGETDAFYNAMADQGIPE